MFTSLYQSRRVILEYDKFYQRVWMMPRLVGGSLDLTAQEAYDLGMALIEGSKILKENQWKPPSQV